ncbi:Adenosine deaminase like [Balamuthia mandrillaris]
MSEEQGVSEEWCRLLPKVELHAHLNGSLRDQTVLELWEQSQQKTDFDLGQIKVPLNDSRTLSECFELFAIIHKVTGTHEALERITREVIEDFAADNVRYLELRTTPRANPESGMTKQSYVETVLRVMNECNERLPIISRLLLSINRTQSQEEAMETVELAQRFKKDGVVGIDWSGNPHEGTLDTFLPAFAKARGEDVDLPLTLHMAEIVNPTETERVISLKPGRVGHACFLSQELHELLLHSTIPIEICLTSNLMTKSVDSLTMHHFKDFYQASHPVILCTDDKGVFSTTLSKEYTLAAEAFQLSRKDLFQVSKGAIGHIFEPNESIKRSLYDIWEKAEESLFSSSLTEKEEGK